MELIKEVYIKGKFNKVVTDNLLLFNIEDNSGLKLDSLEISINNPNDSIEIPQSNAPIEIAIGYNNDLYKMGEFLAQIVDASNNLISIRAVSQNLSKGRVKYNRLFKEILLGDILKTLANDLDLTLQIDSSLQSKQIAYYLQENKTSLEVITELSEIFYAVANVKNKSLLFVSKDNPKELVINIKDILDINKEGNFSNLYSGVIYNSWNIKEAKIDSTKLGNHSFFVLDKVVDISIKNDYINSKFKEIKEQQSIKITCNGNPQFQSGFSFIINSTDKYSQFNGKYRIESVEHKYNNVYVSNIIAVKIG